MTTETFVNRYYDDKFDIDLWNEKSYVLKKVN